MANSSWHRRHVLSLADFTAPELDIVLSAAVSFREVLSRRTRKVPALQGLVVTNLFFEASTRTRSSFELAAKRLSADVLNFAPGTSSLSKGETILDTAKTYLAMGTNLMVIRHQDSGVPQLVAAEMDRLHSGVGVLNAGDGCHAHPSQALLDLFTLAITLNPDHPSTDLLQGKKIAIVGDLLHSRVARSNLWSLTACGAEVHLAAPPHPATAGLRRCLSAAVPPAPTPVYPSAQSASPRPGRRRLCHGPAATARADEPAFASQPAGVSTAVWADPRSPGHLPTHG